MSNTYDTCAIVPACCMSYKQLRLLGSEHQDQIWYKHNNKTALQQALWDSQTTNIEHDHHNCKWHYWQF